MPFRFELVRNWESFGHYGWGRKLLERHIPGYKPSASVFLNELAQLIAGDIRWLLIWLRLVKIGNRICLKTQY